MYLRCLFVDKTHDEEKEIAMLKDACEIALVATKMAREFEQMSIPTREQIAIYASRKGININI